MKNRGSSSLLMSGNATAVRPGGSASRSAICERCELGRMVTHVVERWVPVVSILLGACPGECVFGTLSGSNIRSWCWPACSGGRGSLSGSDLVLVRQAAEDLFSADLVLGKVDLRRAAVCLNRCQLVKRTMRSGGVVVPQVLGQYLAQVVLADDQQPVEDLAAQRPAGIPPGSVRVIRSVPSRIASSEAARTRWDRLPIIPPVR